MANLAVVYQPRVSERLKASTVVGGLTNANYKFIGGNQIVIYSVNTMPLQDYQRNAGSQRFGNAGNIQTTTQTENLGQDKSFNGVIDTLDNDQQMKVLKPGPILARQVREVLIPYIDAYVLQVMETAANVAGTDAIVTPGATTSTNAWANFLTLRSYSINNEGPETGYRAVMTATYYNLLKQGNFLNTGGDMSQKIKRSGFLGDVDGTPVKIAPSTRMPASSGSGASNVDLMIVHPIVTTFSHQLKKFEILKSKIWGIDGVGIQGREAFDAFVDINKIQALTTHRTS